MELLGIIHPFFWNKKKGLHFGDKSQAVIISKSWFEIIVMSDEKSIMTKA